MSGVLSGSETNAEDNENFRNLTQILGYFHTDAHSQGKSPLTPNASASTQRQPGDDTNNTALIEKNIIAPKSGYLHFFPCEIP